MPFEINDGSRPSRLELNQRATGEQRGPVPADHAAALAAARQMTPAFDWEILSSHAHRLSDAPPQPRPARRWWVLAPLLALALALLVIVPQQPTERARGHSFIETFVLHDGVGAPLQPHTRLTEGDQVQFAYSASGQGDSLVLLSIDGDDTLTVFWPDTGDAPLPIEPGTHLLTDSIRLDGSQGPEVFVALFGFESVWEAEALVREAYAADGPAGLLRLADQDPAIDAVLIEKE